MEAPIAEIKPNIKKAFELNLLIVGAIVALIIAILIYLHIIVGLDIFLDTFGMLGIKISPLTLLGQSIFLIIFITTLLLILNYITLGKITYTLYPDKLVYSQSFFVVHIHNKTVPYSNIAKITYKNRVFLNTSNIILELTGMKENKVELSFIDNSEEVVKKIQDLIRRYRANYYAQYTQDYRYQNIMDRF